MNSTVQSKLDSLASFLGSGALYYSGTIPLPPTGCSIFYSSPKGSGVLQVPASTSTELEALTQACEPASFGRGQEDVLDESYRKAWKLDKQHFASHFELSHEFCAELSDLMLGSTGTTNTLAFELYKLNIYSPGSFFKAHVDTPRHENMVGSLVVVLPTPHEGGGLVLRNSSTAWTLDSGSTVSMDPSAPRAAFAAFYSDVEHEVLPVTSGNRLTLTYNLYKVPKGTNSISASETALSTSTKLNAAAQKLKADLEALIGDREFLPKGGYIGFYLAHRCVIEMSVRDGYLKESDSKRVVRALKGLDALLYHVVNDVMKLECSAEVLSVFEDFDDVEHNRLTRYFDNVDGAYEESLDQRIGGTAVFKAQPGDVPKLVGGMEVVPVVWVGKPLTGNERQEAYLTYGNNANIDYFYQTVCLVVRVKRS